MNRTHLTIPGLVQRKPWMDLSILILICLSFGVYRVFTTVLISKDGVVYIERAMQLAGNWKAIFNLQEPPGLPMLIWGFHTFGSLFLNNDSQASWIYAAQISVLSFMAGAIIVLYFLGWILVGRWHAFWGVMILMLLPYPAHFGTDVLRDWPHLFFLLTGLLLLYKAQQQQDSLLFMAAGLVSGLGYIIRSECAQIVLYGAACGIFYAAGAIRRKENIKGLWRYSLLAFGFLSIFLPFASQRRHVVPYKLNELIHRSQSGQTSSVPETFGESAVQKASVFGTAAFVPAVGNLLKGLTENFLYYFVFPAAIGFCLFIKDPKNGFKRLFIGMIVVFYFIALTILDMRWGYISRRHLLTLTALLCLLIPSGIHWISERLFSKHPQLAFHIFIAAGLLLCTPKLMKPEGIEKKAYRQAAEWLKQHTPANTLLYTFDNRLGFYAERPYHVYRHNKITRRALNSDYWLLLSEDGHMPLEIPQQMRFEQRFELNDDKAILIYVRTLTDRERSIQPGQS